MKTKITNRLDNSALATLLIICFCAIPAFADDDPKQSTGQDRVIAAPPAAKNPTAGELNPVLHEEGVTNPGTSLGKSPVEVDPKPLVKSDNDFYKEAAISNATELAASQLAVRQATDPQIRAYATKLVAEHRKMSADLTRLAASKGVKLRDQPDTKRQAALNVLGKTQGKEFDQAYVEQMVKDHQEVTALFEMRDRETKDDATKSLIEASLPMLRQHGEQAKAFYDSGRTK